MELLNNNDYWEELRHDYLIKIGSYEMIFENQKKQIHYLKQINNRLEEGLQMEKAKCEMFMEELEGYDHMVNTYYKSFCN